MGQGRVLPSSQGGPAGGPQDSGQPHSRLRSAPAPIWEKEVRLLANAQMTAAGSFPDTLVRHSRSRPVSLPTMADAGGLGESFQYCSLPSDYQNTHLLQKM